MLASVAVPLGASRTVGASIVPGPASSGAGVAPLLPSETAPPPVPPELDPVAGAPASTPTPEPPLLPAGDAPPGAPPAEHPAAIHARARTSTRLPRISRRCRMTD